MRDDIDALVHELPCPYCYAAPRERCVTSSGRAAQWPHSGRSWEVRQAYAIGYAEAVDDERLLARLVSERQAS